MRTGREAVGRPATGDLKNPFRSLAPHAPTLSLAACVILVGRDTTPITRLHICIRPCGPTPVPQLDSLPWPRGIFFKPPMSGLFVLPAKLLSKNSPFKIPNKTRLRSYSCFLRGRIGRPPANNERSEKQRRENCEWEQPNRKNRDDTKQRVIHAERQRLAESARATG